MYYFLVVLSSILLGVLILFVLKPFFNMALHTVALLDIMLDEETDEDEKQSVMIKRLLLVLKSLFIFMTVLGLSICISIFPVYLYVKSQPLDFGPIDTSSWIFILCLFGGLIPLFFQGKIFKKPESDYSDWSKLLHHLVLDNTTLGKLLFRIAQKRHGKKKQVLEVKALIVTGLARSGTTALTLKLADIDSFLSLTYAHMPFLMSPMIGKQINASNQSDLKERHHGDKVQFGLQSAEALEEYFFKTILNSGFVSEDTLIPHSVEEDDLQSYTAYQNIVRSPNPKALYLAKNNNFILRFEALMEGMQNLYCVIMFRRPIDHAYSLLEQHHKLGALQEKEPFALDYMRWLGHYEFGKDHRPFSLSSEYLSSAYDQGNINYWLERWVDYYSTILKKDLSKRLILVDHATLCSSPDTVLGRVEQLVGISLDFKSQSAFESYPKESKEIDKVLLERAQSIYSELISRERQN